MATRNNIKYDIFIAAPLTSLNSKEYPHHTGVIRDFISWIKDKTSFKEIFFAGEGIYKKIDFDTPKTSIQIDVDALCCCKYFIFIYSVKTITSAFVELGYVMALKKQIHIFVRKRDDLPFIAQYSDEVYNNVTIHEYKIEDNLEIMLRDCVSSFQFNNKK